MNAVSVDGREWVDFGHERTGGGHTFNSPSQAVSSHHNE